MVVAISRWRVLSFLLLYSLLLPARAEIHAPFYQATHNGQTIYILGTLHAGKSDFYPFRPAIETAFKDSSRLFLELNLASEDVKKQISAAMVCQTPCLRSALGEADWSRLEKRLDNKAAVLHQLDHLHPWAAAVVLSAPDLAAIGMQVDLGVDNYLTQLAGNAKPLEGLETAQEQVDVFQNLSQDEQKQMLEEWLDMPDSERLDAAGKLTALWQAGDADALYRWNRELEQRYSRDPEMEKRLDQKFLTNRNHRFVDRLLGRVGNAPGPFFLAVGSLHLGGPEGVLVLLKNQGYLIQAK